MGIFYSLMGTFNLLLVEGKYFKQLLFVWPSYFRIYCLIHVRNTWPVPRVRDLTWFVMMDLMSSMFHLLGKKLKPLTSTMLNPSTDRTRVYCEMTPVFLSWGMCWCLSVIINCRNSYIKKKKNLHDVMLDNNSEGQVCLFVFIRIVVWFSENLALFQLTFSFCFFWGGSWQ